MRKNRSIYSMFVKRTFDLCISFVALIILSPFLLLIALLVRVNLGAPVIYSQERPGK